MLVLSDALEHNWDFETDRIDVEIKRVELESSKRKYSGFKLDLEMSHQIKDWERWRTTTSSSPYTRKQWQETSAYKITTSKQFLNNPSKLSFSYKRNTPWNQYERYKKATFYDHYQTQDYESYIEIEWKLPIIGYRSSKTSLAIAKLNLQKIEYKYQRKKKIYLPKFNRLNNPYHKPKRILPPTFHLSEAQLKIGSRRHRTINL